MKKLFLLVLFSSVFVLVYSQKNDLNSQSHAIPCSGFAVTKPLREIFANFDTNAINYPKKESEDRERRNPKKYKFHPKDGYQYDNDSSIIQQGMGTIPGKAPIANWPGQVASGFRPFDPSGAAGPNHYVQMINSTTFRIHNKSNGAILLTGTLGNLWSPATANNGDPIVMYDKAADRWFLAQFGSSTDKKIYIAISTSPDPTGSYYTYTYTSPAFPDYLKFSVWHDGYYMTSNQAQKVFAFNRSAMLIGTPSASSLYVSFSPPQGTGFFVPLAGDAADGTLPTSGPCPIFSYSDNGWGASYSDAINIFNMSVNWTTTIGSISSWGSVPTATFNAQYNSSWNDCPQPGTTQKLDGIGGVLMFRAQWKSWSGYNTVVLNWAVYISASQRSIMWCELRQNPSTGAWSMYQQGIYTPDAATRWMGSIAMDNNGSIGMAYLKSDATSIYPSLCFTGRTATDPLGTFPIAETVVAVGTGYQSGMNRVGDYAQTVLDPDGITFWHTGEYFGGASGSPAKTQIFSWQISAGSVASVSIALSSGTNPSCSGSSLTFTATPTNGGTAPAYQWKVNGTNVGTNSATFTTSTLNTGDVVTCVMTSNLAGVLSNPATSNAMTITVTALVTPTISISASSTSICSGSSVTFTPTITNGGATPSYQWIKNGSNVATGSSYTTTTLTSGDVITCVLTSNQTCVTSSTATSNAITMTVTTAVTPTVTISGTTTLCAGTNATYTATPTNGGTPSYQWKVNGVNVGTNSATFSSNTLNNNDIVTCVMTSNLACVSPSTATSNNITVSVTTAVTPSVTISGTNTFCAGTNVTFTATPTNGGTPTYQWKVNGVNAGTNSANFSSNTLNNNDIVSCVMTSNLACVSPSTATSNSITVSVTTAATPSVTISGTNTFCAGTNVSFTATPTNGGTPSYQWKRNGSNVGINSNTYSSNTLVNGDVITCVMTSSLSCVSTSVASSNSIVMTVNNTITPTVSITANATTICTGSTVTFTATPVNGGTTPSYQWQLNGINTGTNNNTFSSSALNNNDAVKCIITSNASCLNSSTANSNTIVMTVSNLPAVNAGTYSSPCVGQMVSLIGTPSGGVFSGNGVNGNNFSASGSGVYPVTYTYSNGTCSNSATTQITVVACQVSLFVKAFIEGYYIGNSTMTKTLYNEGVDPNPNSTVTDSIRVELHNPSSPYALAYTYNGLLNTNGTINCVFPASAFGNAYYIVLNHRNTIQTWSSTPITMAFNTSYDFSNAVGKAYGNNETLLSPNVWGMYSGDMNQDMTIDVFDYIMEYMDIQNGLSGYHVTDLNGDGSVDAFDYLLLNPNLYLGVTAQTP